MSSLRSEYQVRFGRRPDAVSGHAGGLFWRRAVSGAHKLSPAPHPVQQPILQHPLRKLQAVVRLHDSKWDRLLWKLWLCQLQGVMRSGDNKRGKGETKRAWNSHLNTQIGRVSADRQRYGVESSRPVICLRLKPTKTDWSKKEGYVKVFAVHDAPGPLSGGMRCTTVRNREWSTFIMHRGTTDFGNFPQDGELVARFMRLWTSGVPFFYMHATERKMVGAGWHVDRG